MGFATLCSGWARHWKDGVTRGSFPPIVWKSSLGGCAHAVVAFPLLFPDQVLPSFPAFCPLLGLLSSL